jgi:peptide chain release factor 2
MEPQSRQALVQDLEERLSTLRSRLAEASSYLNIGRLRERKRELEADLARQGAWDDQKSAIAKSVELGRIEEQLRDYDGLAREVADLAELYELARNEVDEALLVQLSSELAELEGRVLRLELSSLMSGRYDSMNAIGEVHAGAGGTDAQDWAQMLLRMYARWAERRGYRFEVDDVTPGQEAGILSATFIVEGQNAYGLLSCERGVHRLVRISPFDANHRRHTSFASVNVLPLIEGGEEEVEIDEGELKVETFRAGGPGGQHVNKTDSAVRITHLPTGIVVSCQNERSQYQNKQRALQILKSKLAELRRAEREKELETLKGPHTEIGWGNQIRSYVLAPYQLVKDLRTGYQTSSVEQVLDGDIDPFIEAELRRRAALRTGEALATGGRGEATPGA